MIIIKGINPISKLFNLVAIYLIKHVPNFSSKLSDCVYNQIRRVADSILCITLWTRKIYV